MTQDNFPRSFWGRVIEWGKIAGAIAAIVALLSIFVGVLGPVRSLWNTIADDRELLYELDRKFDELDAKFDEVSNVLQMQAETNIQVQAAITGMADHLNEATKPRDIYEINHAQSGPTEGFCVVGQVCEIQMRVRRTVEGVQCDVMPGADHQRHFFMEERSGARVQAFLVSGTPLQNIQRDYTTYVWSFQVPTGMTEPVDYFYEADYNHCRGPDDEAIITDPGEPIRVEFLTPQEAEERRARSHERVTLPSIEAPQ